MPFPEDTEAMIATWHNIEAPNKAGSVMAADLAAIIRAFEAVRDRMAFEEEPSGFVAALQETKE